MQGPLTPELLGAQEVRENILRVLLASAESNLRPGMSFADLAKIVTEAMEGLSSHELNRSVHYLAQSQMIGLRWRKKRKTWRVKIMPRGMDFTAAEFPWEAINEFHPLRKDKAVVR